MKRREFNRLQSKIEDNILEYYRAMDSFDDTVVVNLGIIKDVANISLITITHDFNLKPRKSKAADGTVQSP